METDMLGGLDILTFKVENNKDIMTLFFHKVQLWYMIWVPNGNIGPGMAR